MKSTPPPHREFKIRKVGRCHWPTGAKRLKPWQNKRSVNLDQLWFVWSGAGTICSSGDMQAIEQGKLFWLKPGIFYEVEQDPKHPLGLTYIHFETDCDMQAHNGQLPSLIDELDCNLGESITRRIVELFWESHLESFRLGNPDQVACATPFFTNENNLIRGNPFPPIPIIISAPEEGVFHPAITSANMLFNALMQEIMWQHIKPKLNLLSGMEKFQKDMVIKVIHSIQEDLKSAGSIRDLAATTGYSTDHFTRIFKRVTGATVQEFLLNTRINKAKHWLQDSELSIKEIADKLGYCDSHFFARHFKNVTGRTPSEFRSTSE